jgi:hypothetical protein
MADQYDDMAARELAADAERERNKVDLELLAKLRSHPSFGATLDQIGDVRERCKAGGARNAAEAWSMLSQLLRGA